MSTVNGAMKKRIPAIIIAAMMFFTVFAVLPTTEWGQVYAAGEKGKVTANVLNVRSGAGTGYSKVGTLKKDATFTIKGTTTKSGVKWYKLTYKSKTAYVSAAHVDIIIPTVTQVTNLKGTVNTSKGSLIVRKGPGSIYEKVGTMAKGKKFTITGKVKSTSDVVWYRLTYSGKEAFVVSTYVKTETVPEEPTVTTLTNTTGTVKINSDSLNVRSGPGTNYSVLGSLTNGKTFAATGKVKDSSGKWWYQLKINNKTGYVHSDYVTIKTEEPNVNDDTNKEEQDKEEQDKETTKKETILIGTVNTSSGALTVRSGPGTSYSKLGTLKKGVTIDIEDKVKPGSTTWYKFDFKGDAGYVSGSYMATSKVTSEEPVEVSYKIGTTTAESGLNVRSGAGTGYDVLTVLPKGTMVTVTGSEKADNGKVWYKYDYTPGEDGYICSDYLTIKTITSDNSFELYMKNQGFPESYKAGLRALHDKHPQWVFKAVKVGYDWEDALAKESVVGRNLVSSSAPISHRSTASGSYNSKTKKWTKFDGSWYAANSKVVAYYMDPRNFLSEADIYQFMIHSYDGASQNSSTVKAIIKGSFMEGKNPGGGYSTYQSLIADAGKATGVNPNVLAAMIIQEQGWNGSSLVSGTYSGYKGYYNFFNIGAYTTSSMNAVQRGLWYAKGSGTGATSYSRPWDTPYKSIKGGAQFYAEGYVKENQDSYYSKKFNVYNGLSDVGTHQYMTFVAAAANEGSIVKRGYSSNSAYPVVFEIPVYNNMPATKCLLP